jgi:hypothetical protein
MSNLFLSQGPINNRSKNFSSDNALFTVTSSAVKAANQRNYKVSKENQMFEAVKEDRVPFPSIFTSFKLSK